MSSIPVHDFVLPSDDGAVARAIEDLQTKISKWAQAATAVQETFVSAAASSPRRREDASPTGGSPIGWAEPAASDDAEQQIDALRNAIGEVSAIAANDGSDAGHPPSMAKGMDIDSSLDALDASLANAVRKRLSACGPGVDLQAVINECQQEEREQELLLMSLAPGVAEAIRVEYRLFNGRRSIRELIDEHGSGVQCQQENKSWWNRGRS